MIRGALTLMTMLAGLAAGPAQLDDVAGARLRGQAASVVAGPAQLDDAASARLRSEAQALVDALAVGDKRPWSNFLDERGVFIDEDGIRYTKAEMVAQVTPLPKGVSGSIDITDWRVNILGNVAVETHIADEHEDFHGQKLHALYRVTESWMKQPSGWKLVSSQTLALRQDPPPAALPEQAMQAYVGRYAAAPDYVVEITRDASGLVARTNGGRPQPIKAELADVMFTPGQPRTRKIFQRDSAGRITGFVSRREERDVVFKRLDSPALSVATAGRPGRRAESCPPKLL
jgi:hypothetical protein